MYYLLVVLKSSAAKIDFVDFLQGEVHFSTTDYIKFSNLLITTPVALNMSKIFNTVEALVNGHPLDAKKVYVTGAGRLRGNVKIRTDIVWKLKVTWFCEGCSK